MSLSRVVKKPGNVVFNEIVQIRDLPIEIKVPNHKISSDSVTNDLSTQIINDAQIEAQRIVDEAKHQIQTMRDEFELKCSEVYKQTKQDANKEGYLEGRESARSAVVAIVENLSTNLLALEDEKNKLTTSQYGETQNKVHLLALEVASKIMRQKISFDDAVLKPIIMDELSIRKRQNISLIEVSRQAQKLIQELENELVGLGIIVQTVDKDISHIVIEGNMGRYDLSIETQIKNIKRLFKTI